MKSIFKLSILFLVYSLVGCSGQGQKDTSTVENETDSIANDVKNTAPDASTRQAQGYVLPGLEHGLSQSPININSQLVEGNDKHQITVNFKDEINQIDNLGHTVQLDFKEGSSITADGETFDFKQCHFHTPSEHLIDGMTFPMEMHIVNTMADTSEEGTTQYLVISALFKVGKENKFISEFINSIPDNEGDSKESEIGSIKLSDLFGSTTKEMLGQYYFYRGSLTTPPYTESVRWYVSKHIFEASAAQIETINQLEGNNARHVQALYGRNVSED